MTDTPVKRKLVREGLQDQKTIDAGVAVVTTSLEGGDPEVYPVDVFNAMLKAAPAYEITSKDIENAWNGFWRELSSDQDRDMKAALTEFLKGLNQ